MTTAARNEYCPLPCGQYSRPGAIVRAKETTMPDERQQAEDRLADEHGAMVAGLPGLTGTERAQIAQALADSYAAGKVAGRAESASPARDEAIDGVVTMLRLLEDASFEYESAVESGQDAAVLQKAKEVLDHARSTAGTARFLYRGLSGTVTATA